MKQIQLCLCEQVYQMYAQRSPEEVHAILRAVGADYVVLENSICYERRHRRGCRLRDLLDLANGHVGGIYLMWLGVCWRTSALSLRKDQCPRFPSVCQELGLFLQTLSHHCLCHVRRVLLWLSGFPEARQTSVYLLFLVWCSKANTGWMCVCVNITNTHNLRERDSFMK